MPTRIKLRAKGHDPFRVIVKRHDGTPPLVFTAAERKAMGREREKERRARVNTPRAAHR